MWCVVCFLALSWHHQSIRTYNIISCVSFIIQYATREVGYFLEDSERSKQYVEMRRVAMARANDDLGIENLLQFVAAFVVGMMGSWALNALHTIQVNVSYILMRVCIYVLIFI